MNGVAKCLMGGLLVASFTAARPLYADYNLSKLQAVAANKDVEVVSIIDQQIREYSNLIRKSKGNRAGQSEFLSRTCTVVQ